ncbi:hypothetical protein AWB65_05714 [Caballeronia humi]|uniref:Uncharacterized protein n=1 Tax=Caballeronia humi TaxID=326474 RepID=A0A158J1T3_9BURK|nr:hypothetical protein AWB65_05714 [Caballeronia humi]
MYPAVDLIASSWVLLDAAVVGEEHASNASAPDCGALERRDFACESRLITDTRRQESQQARHFGARLHEAEYVVHQKQHILAALVAKVFCHRERR